MTITPEDRRYIRTPPLLLITVHALRNDLQHGLSAKIRVKGVAIKPIQGTLPEHYIGERHVVISTALAIAVGMSLPDLVVASILPFTEWEEGGGAGWWKALV